MTYIVKKAFNTAHQRFRPEMEIGDEVDLSPHTRESAKAAGLIDPKPVPKPAPAAPSVLLKDE